MGYELYVRRGDGSGSPFVAITLNLGLKSGTDEPSGRPLACRVAIRLLKPGQDGVAEDRDEIERISRLAVPMIERLGSVADTLYGGMYTSAAIRTWLFYAPRTDRFGEIVAAAFAGQHDYVPTIEIDADPQWDRYAALYPTEAELRDIRFRRAVNMDLARARAMTAAWTASLRDRGDDLQQSRPIDYAVNFPGINARSAFVAQALNNGFRLAKPIDDSEPGPGKTVYSVNVFRDGPADPASVFA